MDPQAGPKSGPDEIPAPGSLGPRKYMSKRQSACDACRARKSACQIEKSPPCRLCIAHSKPCTFKGHKVARRPPMAKQSMPYQSLALTPALATAEDGSSIVSSFQLTQCESPSRTVTPSGSFTFYDDDWNDLFTAGLGEGDVLSMDPDIPFNNLPGSGLDSMSTDSLNAVSFDDVFGVTPNAQVQERSLDNLPSMAAELCGLTGDMDPYVLRRYRYNDRGEFEFSKLSIRATQDDAVPVQFLLSPTELSSASRAEAELEDGGLGFMDGDRERLSHLIPMEIGKRLIQLFLKFICPQFPILSRTALPDPQTAPYVPTLAFFPQRLQKSGAADMFLETGTRKVHLLAAIYSVAQPFAIYDDRLCIDFAYRAPSTETLFNISWKSLNRALHVPTIAAVQSGLALLLRPPVNELVLDSGFKWSLLGTIVALAQSIGLHLDASSWKLPREELLLRKRISWAVFAFDKWLALSLGRPSHINKQDWLVVQLEVADLGDEIDNTSPELSICLQLSGLTSILDRVLTELYSVRIAISLASDHKATLQASQSLLVLLTSWYQSLDPHFHTPATEDLSGDPDPTFSVHLCYHAVKTIILRALLRPFYTAGATQPTDPKARAEWASAKHHSRLGAKICANAAVKHVSSFRANHYQAFWAPWCKTHLAMITNLLCLLAITSPPEEFAGALSSLNQARAIFRVQARSCPMIQFALLRIDAIFWVGFDTVIDNNNHGNEHT